MNFQDSQQPEGALEAAGLGSPSCSTVGLKNHQLKSLGVDTSFKVFEQKIKGWVEKSREDC